MSHAPIASADEQWLPRPKLTRIADLAVLGLDSDILRHLAESLGATTDLALTRFQAETLSDPMLRNLDRNVIVAGPTSAGKTLVASVVAALTRKSHPGKKIVYVVPLRALVTEKAAEWKLVFGDARVLPVSSEYPRSDHFVRSGNWDIAVVVLEKLYQWLSEGELVKRVVPQLGLVVLDELQVIGEAGRGEKLELAVTLLRHYQKQQETQSVRPFPILAMGVSREIAAGLNQWLDACVVPDCDVPRPVQLFEAVVQRHRDFSVRIEASGKRIPSVELPTAVLALLNGAPGHVQLVERALRSGLRVLLYSASRRSAAQVAAGLVRVSPYTSIHPALGEELDALEESPTLGDLRKLLAARIGFHHGHMSPDERAIVERGFRMLGPDSPVMVIVATRTLAMGVNLPADIVVFTDVHTGRHRPVAAAASSYVRKLTVAEYRNLAGRAGRLRPGLPEDAFGLVVVYKKNGEWAGVAEELLNGIVEKVPSSLENPEFGWGAHAVAALAFHESFHHTGTTTERVTAVLDDSYLRVTAGAIHDRPAADLSRLEALGVVTESGLTGAGNAVARFGLSVDALDRLIALASDLDRWWPSRRLALLDALFETPELAQFLRPPNSDGPRSGAALRIRAREVSAYFTRYLDPTELVPGTSLARWLGGGPRAKPETVDVARFIKAVALRQWSDGVRPSQLIEYSTSELKRKLSGARYATRRLQAAFYYMTIGQLRDAAEMVTALLGALRQLYLQLDTERESEAASRSMRGLWIWEQSVRHGTAPDRVALPIVVSYATNERLRRHTINELFEAMGRPRDPRPWLDKPAPAGVKSRVWDALQAGLRWWRDDAGGWFIVEHEPDAVRRSLDDLVAPPPKVDSIPHPTAVPVHRPTIIGSTCARPPLAEQGIVESSPRFRTLELLEGESRRQVAQCGGRHGALLSLVLQEITRAPVLAVVRGVDSSKGHRHPRGLVRIGEHLVPVEVWPGDLDLNDLAHLRPLGGSAPGVLIVGGTISSGVERVPTTLQGIVSASSLFALCRWAQHRPGDLFVVRSTLTQPGTVLRRASEAFALAASERE